MVVPAGESGGKNNFVSITKMQRSETLMSPPSLSSSSNPPDNQVSQPFLPLEIVEEILCRLLVKLLSQLRCVCKSWNLLISDPNFAKKHLRYSNKDFTRWHLMLHLQSPENEICLLDFSLPSFFHEVTPATTEPRYPIVDQEHLPFIIGSCDGFLYSIIGYTFLVWNPSIQKFKILPPLEILQPGGKNKMIWHGFGYDHLTDSYKAVSIFHYRCDGSGVKSQVNVHTLGTDSWRRIEDFPYTIFSDRFAKFVSGTLNMLSLTANDSCTIVSLDLGKESYQEIPLPDYGDGGIVSIDLTVQRDCLCIVAQKQTISDIWLMKEYGIQESWTKLFSVSRQDPKPYPLTIIHISEDDEILLDHHYKGIVYNPRHDTFKTLFQYEGFITLWVYVESLLSP